MVVDNGTSFVMFLIKIAIQCVTDSFSLLNSLCKRVNDMITKYFSMVSVQITATSIEQ